MSRYDRITKFRRSCPPAMRLAERLGLELSNPSTGCYQLREPVNGWILNLYGRSNGANPRAYHDPNHQGPFLPLPDCWNLLDVVQSAAEHWLPNVNPKELANG